MAAVNIFSLEGVDYSDRGKKVKIEVDGVAKTQTIVFAGLDYFDATCFFTQESLKYITDSRLRRRSQKFVLNYFDKIPKILKVPLLLGRNRNEPNNFIYCQRYAINEHQNRKELLAVVLKKSNISVVWNFYWRQAGKIPVHAEISESFK